MQPSFAGDFDLYLFFWNIWTFLVTISGKFLMKQSPVLALDPRMEWSPGSCTASTATEFLSKHSTLLPVRQGQIKGKAGDRFQTVTTGKDIFSPLLYWQITLLPINNCLMLLAISRSCSHLNTYCFLVNIQLLCI